MKFGFVVDPIEKLVPKKDSSIDMMIEAASRGHAIHIFEHADISCLNGEPIAATTEIAVERAAQTEKALPADTFALVETTRTRLETFDAIFIRKDPPFDSEYLSLTFLLEPIEDKVVFLNSPSGVRHVSEKLSMPHFPNLTPQTLIAYKTSDLRAFAQKFEKVVIKTAYFGSGKGVFLTSATDPRFDDLIAEALAIAPTGPVICQEFLPQVHAGDTRVMVLDGEIVGALGRKPSDTDFRANIAAGGHEFAVEPSEQQRAATLEVARMLTAHGIIFAGLDFIGDKLIEVNVTSPTLLIELRRVGGGDVAALIIDSVERHARAS